ncbi:MAG: hypothetical protein AAF805_10795 [Planctomycetota bacterium]
MPRFSLATLLIAMMTLAVLFAVMVPFFRLTTETNWLLLLSVEAAFYVALLPVLWIALNRKPPEAAGDDEPEPGP